MKYLLILLVVFFSVSCDFESKNDNSVVTSKIRLVDADRSIISGLNSLSIDYILEKDNGDYATITDFILNEDGGSYNLSLDLLSGATYVFTLFKISTDNGLEYILDDDSTLNAQGFTISADGLITPSPKLYLKKVSGVEYDLLDYENIDISIELDESSQLGPTELTFRVSSNVVDATFEIFKYSVYWRSGGILIQNDIFDMDTGQIFDPLEDGDNVSWGTGKFKIVTTDSLGVSVSIVGISEDWSMKHIRLNL